MGEGVARDERASHHVPGTPQRGLWSRPATAPTALQPFGCAITFKARASLEASESVPRAQIVRAITLQRVEMLRKNDRWVASSDVAAQFDRAGRSRRSSGFSAGPAITRPSAVKRDPWQGQSHVRSAVFHST